ncbi:hypothetical protein [Gordonia jinhuaensis]|uniref:hypothetical protein n=1 Tax=Gordonia jinhuaensis TaxID=1517702 RepID=UPI00166611F7|nr:hypothetical protein [Gordonia jinhuaensis]
MPPTVPARTVPARTAASSTTPRSHALLSQAGAHHTGATRTTVPIRLHGRGAVTERLTAVLREHGHRVETSVRRPVSSPTRRPGAAALPSWSSGLVILTDFLVHDSMIRAGLMRRRIPHLVATVDGGVGIVGPLVLPGLSSCLGCADRHRAALDPAWPATAAALVGRSGCASPATVAITAALAFEQVQQIIEALDGHSEDSTGGTSADPPQLLDRALEFGTRPFHLRMRARPPHPLCGCLPSHVFAPDIGA